LTSVLIIGLPLTGAPAGTSIAEGDAPIANMRETFDYAFILMTAISVVGILLANFLRDHALEEFLANEKGPGRVVTSTAASTLASEPQEGGGSG
jgi:hypothetical protein